MKKQLSWLWNAPYVLIALAALFWSANSVIGRAISTSVSPISLTFWRWLLAALLMVLIALPKLKQEWRTALRLWRHLFLLSLFGIASFSLLLYFGLGRTTAINGLIVQAAQPSITILALLVLYGQQSRPSAIVGVLLSLAGVAVIVSGGSLSFFRHLTMNTGDLLILTATLLYSIYTIMLGRRTTLHPLVLAASTFTFAAVMLAPLYVAELALGQATSPTWSMAVAVLFVAVFSSCLAYLFYNRAAQTAGATTAASVTNIMPLFGSLLAALFLGEGIGLHHLLAFFMIIGGVLLVRRAQPSA